MKTFDQRIVALMAYGINPERLESLAATIEKEDYKVVCLDFFSMTKKEVREETIRLSDILLSLVLDACDQRFAVDLSFVRGLGRPVLCMVDENIGENALAREVFDAYATPSRSWFVSYAEFSAVPALALRALHEIRETCFASLVAK